MSEEKVDRRVRKTKKLLMQSLTKLLAEKKVNKITVTELTDLADLNRSTFYLYYKDIFDMLDQIEYELVRDFNKACDEFSSHEITYDNMLSFLTFLFEFVNDNADIFKILIGSNEDYSFIEKFKKTIRKHHPSLENVLSEKSLHYFRPYIISVCIGVMQQWLEDGTRVPPKDMAVLMTGLISDGLHSLNPEKE